MDLSDDRLAKAAVDLRGLVVEDTCGEVDDYQGVLNEGKAIHDGFDNLSLNFFKVVLRLWSARS